MRGLSEDSARGWGLSKREGAGGGEGRRGWRAGTGVWRCSGTHPWPTLPPRGSPLPAGARCPHPASGRGRGGGCARRRRRRRRRESGLGCSRRPAWRCGGSAATPRPATPRASRAEVGPLGRGAAGQPDPRGTAEGRAGRGAGSGRAAEESPVGEGAPSGRLRQTRAGLGACGAAGPRLRTPGAARDAGASSESVRVAECHCAPVPGTARVARGECALLGSGRRSGPGGEGAMRARSEPQRPPCSSSGARVGACVAVCERHSAGLFTWRPL